MNLHPYLPMLMGLTLSCPVLAENTSPYFQMDSFFLSEPVALDAVDDDWNGRYHPNGENQIASVWVESGINKGSWFYGALFREEHQLRFDSDSADLYYAVANNKDLTADRVYQLDLDAYRFRGYGARIGKTFSPGGNLKFTLGTSLFHASNLLDGNLSGSASANSTDQYTYDFDVNYQYDEDLLLDRKGTDAPDGIGLSLDLALDWKPTKQLQIEANVKDLAGAIYWKDVPYTKAVASSDTTTVREDGFSQVNPAISGIEGYNDSYTQTLRPSANLSAEYNFSNSPYSANLKSKHYKDLSLFSIGGGKNIGNGKLTLNYWPQTQTLEASYQSKRFSLSLGLDEMDLSEANTFWLSVKHQ